MSVCFDVLFAWKCSSTHHKLAMDALRHLRRIDAEDWTNLFLRFIEFYLDGSKAPDNKFKDFRNHVLHVREGFWGGAVAAAESWYVRTVEALRRQQWPDAVYSAGVLSHYYTDPIQPFHTGQSDAEAIVHRAAEWSIAKSYEELQNILEQDLGGYPDVEVPVRPDWLAEMVRQGAQLANPHYETLIDHYNLKAGVANPPAGLDQESKDILAPLIGHAAVGFARILERAIEESGVVPPKYPIALHGILNSLTVPIYAVTKKMRDLKERVQVEAMYREFERTGKVIYTLPEDDKATRRLHAEEVLHKSLAELDAEKPRPPGALHGTGAPPREGSRRACTHPVLSHALPLVSAGTTTARPLPVSRVAVPHKTAAHSPLPHSEPARRDSDYPRPLRESVAARPPGEGAERVSRAGPQTDSGSSQREPEPDFEEASAEHSVESRSQRFYLDKSQPLVQAPSIGHKTANRFERIGARTVADFLNLDPDDAARRLNVRHIDADTIRSWQAQARLACRVPNIRGHDAQLLVACGVTEPEDLASHDPDELLSAVHQFCATADGQRILRSSPKPDLAEIRRWIASASHSRALRAA